MTYFFDRENQLFSLVNPSSTNKHMGNSSKIKHERLDKIRIPSHLLVMKEIIFSLILLFSANYIFADGHEDCALMLGDAIDPEEYSEVMGVKVYFCCGACVKAFDAATAYYLKALPELAKKFSDEQKKELGVDKVELLDQRFCPIYPERIVNPTSKSVDYNGKKIYFWSSSAERRWKRDPERYFKEAMERGHLPQYK